MGAIKRKEAPATGTAPVKKQKTAKLTSASHDDDFGGFSDGSADETVEASTHSRTDRPQLNDQPKQFKLETSSAEAHAKQRALAKERKAAKPLADETHRSKKIWERLRRKSHVPVEERKQLITELFEIINGRISDFVFKHDSVRVVQCALKYANVAQRRQIAQELQRDIRTLAESRYGKFLVAKMVSTGDDQVRDLVVPQFYGHVRRLINHPEASWIVDDIYRGIATPQQKSMMLREWYGAEFALFHRKPDHKAAATVSEDDTADLAKILERNPEKRKPVLQFLLQMINGLVQKQMTGFTMLHDAMLQYFLVLTPGSDEHNEFLEILKNDIDKESEGGGGDVFKNLAFTKSGTRLVCLALAYGGAKDRKTIMRVFKDVIETMAFDNHAKMVLVTALDVADDTKMSGKAIFPELLHEGNTDETAKLDQLELTATNLNARLVVLSPLSTPSKWLLNDHEKLILDEVYEIRKNTSKKDSAVKRKELVAQISAPLLELVAKRAENLASTSFGCQFITEVMLDTTGDKEAANASVAALTGGDPEGEGHLSQNSAAGRMLKTLVLGGPFDPKTKSVTLPEERLAFGAHLYPVIKDHLLQWACGESSFVIVGLLESGDVEEEVKKEVKSALKKGKKMLEAAAAPKTVQVEGKAEKKKGNAGSRILLEKL